MDVFDRDGFWDSEEEHGRSGAPEKPPALSAEVALAIFGLTLQGHNDLTPRRIKLQSEIARALLAVEDADITYRDRRYPKSRLAEAVEWGRVRANVEALQRKVAALMAVVLEEEGRE